MSDIVKKILRKIHGTHLPALVTKPISIEEAMHADNYKREFWERDKKTVRDANFKKAQLKLEVYRELQKMENERQAMIAENRLKNLKKARRKLAKIRST